ncbi:hypothetical protein Cadr_000000524 [Camelus dromedarius]|uniref:Uncharacterized protein n=1 Tax=Camelus dromedarius TaxID=9838 RepID=A0A5N4EKY5_CAMDR|nr:hypothetical protein Cadr_000000524 [Camelus dromedarius]
MGSWQKPPQALESEVKRMCFETQKAAIHDEGHSSWAPGVPQDAAEYKDDDNSCPHKVAEQIKKVRHMEHLEKCLEERMG